jgi:hypothetical protein
VLDVGSGSGIVAITAAKAGARKVVACDIDPTAMIAIQMNADANGVTVSTRNTDCFTDPPGDSEVVLAADVFYESGLASRAHQWLREAAGHGAYVLAADPGRGLLHTASARQLARLEVPAYDELPDGAKDTVNIYHVSEADVRTESPGMFGTGVADYALEPRYAELLWDVSTVILRFQARPVPAATGAGQAAGSAGSDGAVRQMT